MNIVHRKKVNNGQAVRQQGWSHLQCKGSVPSDRADMLCAPPLLSGYTSSNGISPLGTSLLSGKLAKNWPLSMV